MDVYSKGLVGLQCASEELRSLHAVDKDGVVKAWRDYRVAISAYRRERHEACSVAASSEIVKDRDRDCWTVCRHGGAGGKEQAKGIALVSLYLVPKWHSIKSCGDESPVRNACHHGVREHTSTENTSAQCNLIENISAATVSGLRRAT